MLSARAIPVSGGATLVELIAFLVIVSIGAVALLGSYWNILPRAPTPAQITQATLLAQERLELISAQRSILGFGSLALDPCRSSAVGVCTPPRGFSIQVVGDNALVAWLSNPATTHRQVTVEVSASGTRLARQITVFTNY